jgi:hypothetical protein
MIDADRNAAQTAPRRYTTPSATPDAADSEVSKGNFGIWLNFQSSRRYIASVAKLWITGNDYYVRRGYPFVGPDGDNDSFVRTYHVSPRGSSLMLNLRWKDGQEIPKSIFYALVIDGDLVYPGTPVPPIAAVPTETRSAAGRVRSPSGPELRSYASQNAVASPLSCRFSIRRL